MVNGMKFDARTLFALQRRGLVVLQGSVYALTEEAGERKEMLNEVHQIRRDFNIDIQEAHRQQEIWVGTGGCAYMNFEQLEKVLRNWEQEAPPILDPSEYSEEALKAQFDFLN